MRRTRGLTSTAPIRCLLLLIVGALSVLCTAEVHAQPVDSEDEKLRIMVDKTYMNLNEDQPLTEGQVEDIADAGFNVVVPRLGAGDPEFLERCATWAEENGIAFMPWMRGTRSSKDGPEMVWGDGTVTPITSPTSDRLWNWMTRRITTYARLSNRVDSVMGVFLDYEIYAHPKRGNAYSLSYDRNVLRTFADAHGLDLPELAPDERRVWLKDENLLDRFWSFQVKRWRQRCRTLREKVHEINPEFQFCVYPPPGTPFMKQAIYREWPTETAPLILADHSGYGRRGQVPHRMALEANRRVFLRQKRTVEQHGFPHRYIGGIDPKVQGADPEFSGKNALMQASVSDGYWVFYEGPTQESWQDRLPYFTPGTSDHEAYMKWFTWANEHIQNGTLDAWKEPRQTTDLYGISSRPPELRPFNDQGTRWTTEDLRKPATRIRGAGLYYVRTQAGEPVRFFMRGHQLGDYPVVPRFQLHDPQGKRIKTGTLPHGKRITYQFTPEQDGIYQLTTYARQNLASVRIDAPQWVLVPPGYPDKTNPFSLCQFARRLYVHVPSDTREFTVKATAPSGKGERASMRVLDPDGNVVEEGESTRTVELRISVPEQKRGTAWSVVVSEPEEGGIFEDVSLAFDGVSPLLSESPKSLLMPARGK